MLNTVVNAVAPWVNPVIDYHALAPEMVLAAGLCVVLLADLFMDESRKWILSSLAGFTLLGAMLPVLTLGLHDTDVRSMFDGRYVVDNFSLVIKALFLLAGYVVVLLSSNHVEEDEYWRGEYYFLLLSSILGMVMISSSRDLVSIFVALEFLSIPAYMLAAWRKRDIKSNEAGVKYFLLGVFAWLFEHARVQRLLPVPAWPDGPWRTASDALDLRAAAGWCGSGQRGRRLACAA